MDIGGRSFNKRHGYAHSCKKCLVNNIYINSESKQISPQAINYDSKIIKLEESIRSIYQLNNFLMKTIFIRPDNFPEKTYFNENGVRIDNHLNRRGDIISIQTVHYSTTNDWKDFDYKNKLKVENGYVCYFGNRNPNRLRSGDFRVVVLVYYDIKNISPHGQDNRPIHGNPPSSNNASSQGIPINRPQDGGVLETFQP
jgi:hypothetical protein